MAPLWVSHVRAMKAASDQTNRADSDPPSAEEPLHGDWLICAARSGNWELKGIDDGSALITAVRSEKVARRGGLRGRGNRARANAGRSAAGSSPRTTPRLDADKPESQTQPADERDGVVETAQMTRLVNAYDLWTAIASSLPSGRS